MPELDIKMFPGVKSLNLRSAIIGDVPVQIPIQMQKLESIQNHSQVVFNNIFSQHFLLIPQDIFQCGRHEFTDKPQAIFPISLVDNN